MRSTSREDALLIVKGVSKKYCRSLRRSLWYGLSDIVGEITPSVAATNSADHSDGRRLALRRDEFWALRDVNFELRRGECIGLIGRNGAGKTTLLKMLNGLIKPDAGRIEVRGRVGALIALGAGFNPILSGRENIYVSGALLGIKKTEIDKTLGEIINFSGVGDFIDAPVQSYSSGMHVRLGFAVASALRPDVLLVDEVLAVGDNDFRIKCYNRIRDMLPFTAVVFVSHSMFDIAKICSRVIVMNQGQVHTSGDVELGVAAYNSLNAAALSGSPNILTEGWIRDASVSISCDGCESLSAAIKLLLKFESDVDYGWSRMRVVFFDETSYAAAEWDSAIHPEAARKIKKGLNIFDQTIAPVRLRGGVYTLSVVVTDPQNRGYLLNIASGLKIIIKNTWQTGAVYKI